MRSAARSLLPTIAVGVILLGAAYRLRSAVVAQAPPAAASGAPAPGAAARGAPAASVAGEASRPEGAPRGGCAGSGPP